MPPDPPRLPIPGADEDAWGDILNRFLEVEHEEDGTLKTNGTLGAYAPLANPTFTGSVTVPTPANDNDAASKEYVDDSLADEADDDDVVKLTGNQTVAGEKTFTSSFTLDYSSDGKIGTFIAPGQGSALAFYSDASDDILNAGLVLSSGSVIFGSGESAFGDAVIAREAPNVLNFSANSNPTRLTSIQDPVQDQDAATKKYVDEGAGGATSGYGLLSERPDADEVPAGSTFYAIDDAGGRRSVSNGTNWIAESIGAEAVTVSGYGNHVDDDAQVTLEALDDAVGATGWMDQNSLTSRWMASFMGEHNRTLSHDEHIEQGQVIVIDTAEAVTNSNAEIVNTNLVLTTGQYAAGALFLGGSVQYRPYVRLHNNQAFMIEFVINLPAAGSANRWVSHLSLSGLPQNSGFSIKTSPTVPNTVDVYYYVTTGVDTLLASVGHNERHRFRLTSAGEGVWQWWLDGVMMHEQATGASAGNVSPRVMFMKNDVSGGTTQRSLTIEKMFGVW